jgi:hypothetical protein
MKVQITASEKEAQDEMIVNANNEKMLLNQKLRMAEKKSKKLESILLQAGLAPTGLDDDKVYKGFETLRFGILQLVKQICTNRNASIKDNIYSKLSDEAKDYYVMAIVAQALYKHCFSQEKIYFGFDATADGMLAQFYSNVSNHSKGLFVRAPYPYQTGKLTFVSVATRHGRLESTYLSARAILG